MGRVTTGVSAPYSDADTMALLDALILAFSRWAGSWGMMAVTAEIEWAGCFNARPVRSTTLGPLELAATRAATEQAARARDAAQRTYGRRPAAGWAAQIRELTRTSAGYAAADRAGLNVSRRTLLGWLAQEQTPSKANRERIERAAISLQYERAAQARDKASAAARAAADALTEAIAGPHDDVRLRDIHDLSFHDPN